jgi:hypothetical protein
MYFMGLLRADKCSPSTLTSRYVQTSALEWVRTSHLCKSLLVGKSGVFTVCVGSTCWLLVDVGLCSTPLTSLSHLHLHVALKPLQRLHGSARISVYLSGGPRISVREKDFSRANKCVSVARPISAGEIKMKKNSMTLTIRELWLICIIHRLRHARGEGTECLSEGYDGCE